MASQAATRMSTAEGNKETLTRVVVDRPAGQLAGAIGDEGQRVVMVRRRKDEEWRVVCKGNLTADNSDLLLASSEAIIVDRLRIEGAARRVLVDGEVVELTGKEFDLLLTLAREPHRVYRNEELLEEVWGYPQTIATRTLTSHVSRVRGKLSLVGPTDSSSTAGASATASRRPRRAALADTADGLGLRLDRENLIAAAIAERADPASGDTSAFVRVNWERRQFGSRTDESQLMAVELRNATGICLSALRRWRIRRRHRDRGSINRRELTAEQVSSIRLATAASNG